MVRKIRSLTFYKKITRNLKTHMIAMGESSRLHIVPYKQVLSSKTVIGKETIHNSIEHHLSNLVAISVKTFFT